MLRLGLWLKLLKLVLHGERTGVLIGAEADEVDGVQLRVVALETNVRNARDVGPRREHDPAAVQRIRCVA